MLLTALLLLLLAGSPAHAAPPCRNSVVRVERAFEVFADYHQFVVADARSRLGGLPDAWTDAAIARGHVSGPGWIGVGTARNVEVPVTVRVLAGPAPAATGWERAAETTLDVPSGELVVSSVTAAAGTGERLRVTPGRYRARILAAGLDSVSPDGLSGSDRYSVELWPDRP